MSRKTNEGHKEIELESDAWERFERAVDVVAKSPPQHRTDQSKATKKKVPAQRGASSKR